MKISFIFAWFNIKFKKEPLSENKIYPCGKTIEEAKAYLQENVTYSQIWLHAKAEFNPKTEIVFMVDLFKNERWEFDLNSNLITKYNHS